MSTRGGDINVNDDEEFSKCNIRWVKVVLGVLVVCFLISIFYSSKCSYTEKLTSFDLTTAKTSSLTTSCIDIQSKYTISGKWCYIANSKVLSYVITNNTLASELIFYYLVNKSFTNDHKSRFQSWMSFVGRDPAINALLEPYVSADCPSAVLAKYQLYEEKERKKRILYDNLSNYEIFLLILQINNSNFFTALNNLYEKHLIIVNSYLLSAPLLIPEDTTSNATEISSMCTSMKSEYKVSKSGYYNDDGVVQAFTFDDDNTVLNLLLSYILNNTFSPSEKDEFTSIMLIIARDPKLDKVFSSFKNKKIPSNNIHLQKLANKEMVLRGLFSNLVDLDAFNLLLSVNDSSFSPLLKSLYSEYVYDGGGKQGVDWEYQDLRIASLDLF